MNTKKQIHREIPESDRVTWDDYLAVLRQTAADAGLRDADLVPDSAAERAEPQADHQPRIRIRFKGSTDYPPYTRAELEALRAAMETYKQAHDLGDDTMQIGEG